MKASLLSRLGVAAGSICVIGCALSSWAFADGTGARVNTDPSHPGGTIALTGAMIMFVVELMRSPRLGGLVERIPRRWRVAVPVLLSGVAGILWHIQGGARWQDALYIGLFAGPTAVFAHEAVVEAILGHARGRDGRASTARTGLTGSLTSPRVP